MKKHTLWGSLILGSAVALTGCNSGSDSDSSSTGDKLPSGGATVNFTLLQTTDLHHHAETYARLATEINRIKQEKPEDSVKLIDSGDFVMGTVYDMTLTSSPTNGNEPPAAFQFLQDVNYDVVALGNHEFDYGDESLARWLDNSAGENFPPIVATNMVADNSPSIKKHVDGEVIRQSFIQTLFKGTDQEITVGFIGLMGPEAVTTITNAPKIRFNNKIEDLQTQVNELKGEGANIIVALSHSGLTNISDPKNPVGDDADYAKKLTGIDIIATGHAHTLIGKAGGDQKPIEVKNGDHTTYIFGGGAYGDFLAQLDVTYTKGQGVTGVKLVNHDIKTVTVNSKDKTVKAINEHVTAAQKQIKELAQIEDFNQIVAKRGNTEFAKPETLGESSLGNLLADATRYSYTAYGQDEAGEGDYTIETSKPVSLVANGVIRGDFAKTADISFSDMYDVLSLGLSIDPQQQELTGSPLFRAYLTAQELKSVARLIGYGLASGDGDYLAKLALQARDEKVVAAGINITGFLNGIFARKDLGDNILEQVDFEILGARLGSVGIDLEGIINDLVIGKDFNLDVIISHTDLELFGKALASVNLTVWDILKLLNNDPLSNPDTMKIVPPLLELLESGTTSKLLASSTIKLFIINQIQPEWYLNASGLRATFNDEYEVAKVELYEKEDIHSHGDSALTPLFDRDMKDSKTLYPVIADQYMLLLMYGPEFSLLRNLPQFAINPKTKDGKVIEFDINRQDTHKNLMDMAVRDTNYNEVKAWQALQTFFEAQANGSDSYTIPDSQYNEKAMADGQNSSRINFTVSQ